MQIFLSYAREDNSTYEIAPDNPGWVSCFFNALKQELILEGQLDTRLWRDLNEIAPYEQFADDIEDGLQCSDVLISVLSPVYIQKKWCVKELTRFAEIKGSKTRAEKECIVKVVKRPIDREAEPEALQGQAGYRFYNLDRETGDFVDYYHPGKGKASEAFFDEVLKLARDLIKRSRSVAQAKPKPEDDASAPAPKAAPIEVPAATAAAAAAEAGLEDRGTVFLGFETSDLERQARQVRGELEGLGFTVLPERNAMLPVKYDAVKALIEEALGRSDHAIIMLGQSNGFTPEGAPSPIVELQLDLAREAEVNRIIWAAPGAHDEQLATVLEDLRSGATLQPGDELIEEGFDRLKGYLASLGKPAAAPAAQDTTAMLAELIKNLDPAQRAQLLSGLGGQGANA